jgi:error-prone DNA polymerase
MLDDQLIHLRAVSGYSFKFGTATTEKLVSAAADHGMSALALTDRDTLAGAIRFTQACMQSGITPIIGVNLKFLSDKNRVTLLALSQSGYSSLVKFLTAVNLELQNDEKIITRKILEENSHLSKNLILLHGPDSIVQQAIEDRSDTLAKRHISELSDFFSYQVIECVSHLAKIGRKSTDFAARALIFAREAKIDAVISNEVRYLCQSDAPVADILDCARNLAPLHEKNIKRANAEAYLKSSDQMRQIAAEIARSAGERSPARLLEDTLRIAALAMLSPTGDIGIGQIHLPEPGLVHSASYQGAIEQFRQRIFAGVNWRYGGHPDSRYEAALVRAENEISVVRTLGFESYFLVVADVVAETKKLGIRVAARGSGAGSLICYALGISGVDPLAHGLIMERFCSPLRRELPDIDIDVESARRLEVYDLVFKNYPGRSATVAMVETYRARHAIRDVGAALAIAPIEIDLIAKSLPRVRASKISSVLDNLPELRSIKDLINNSPTLKMAVGLAEKLDSLPRNLAMHPCAVVISDESFLERTPLEINASGYLMAQFDKDDVEAIGLLKLDILGVRMQSALAYTIAELERTEEKKIDLDAIALDDEPTFQLIQSTKTLGIFQIESPGQRELVGKFSPSSFNDLIIDISLFRPGPVKSDMISPFLSARHGHSSAKSFHPDLAPILAETEGVVVFHEQVIQIISVMTGSSFAVGDEKRRELGSPEGQQRVCDWFYPTALTRGYSKKLIDEIWQVLRAFASFGFCKAHAAAFALPTYQSAWLKTHYPAHFLAGILTHDPGMYPKRLLLDEVRQLGIEIIKVDVNTSERYYRVVKTDGKDSNKYAIEIALTQIHGISEDEINSIIAHRPYRDLADFIHRSGTSQPIAESLVLIGAFSSIYGDQVNRRDLLLYLGDIYRLSHSKDRQISQGQMSFGFIPDFQRTGLPEITEGEQVKNELELLGMEVSHHLMEFYAEFLNLIGAVRSSDLLKHRSNSRVLVAGVKVALQTPPVRSGRRVIFVTLSDGYGCSDLSFFEDTQESYAELLYSSSLLLIRGVTRRTGARGISLRAEQAWDLPLAYEKWLSRDQSKVDQVKRA